MIAGCFACRFQSNAIPRVRVLLFASTIASVPGNSLRTSRRPSPDVRSSDPLRFRPSSRERWQLTRAGMGAFINSEQLLRIDLGVGLGGGERRMAEQFLHRAQIAAIGEQMRGEGMA